CCLIQQNQTWTEPIQIEPWAQLELEWWVQQVQTNLGMPLHKDLQPTMTIFTDASETGYGIVSLILH
ncbi:hypothetical protein H4R33_007023, partial [Dimargaris cristalligena]